MHPRADAVRPKIWKFLLQSTREINPENATAATKGLFMGETTRALLYLDQRSSLETTWTLYHENTFRFSGFSQALHSTSLLDFMQNMTPANRRALRRIHIVINPKDHREMNDYYMAAGLAYFVGHHQPKATNYVPPSASLENLKITIWGDGYLTKDDYILLVPPQDPQKGHQLDEHGRLKPLKVRNGIGKDVVINSKPLRPGPESNLYKPIEGLRDGLKMSARRHVSYLTVDADGTSKEVLLAQEKLVIGVLLSITGYKELQVIGNMDKPLYEALARSQCSDGLAYVLMHRNGAVRDGSSVLSSNHGQPRDGQPFSLDEMVRINWPPMFGNDAMGQPFFPDPNHPDPEERRYVMGWIDQPPDIDDEGYVDHPMQEFSFRSLNPPPAAPDPSIFRDDGVDGDHDRVSAATSGDGIGAAGGVSAAVRSDGGGDGSVGTVSNVIRDLTALGEDSMLGTAGSGSSSAFRIRGGRKSFPWYLRLGSGRI